MSQRLDWSLLVVLWLDAVVLACLELFFLPLRFDGWLLPQFNALPFPVTALLAAVTTPWLVLSAARLSSRGLVAASPLLIWIGSLLAFWFITPGGVTAMLPDWRSLLLVGAGAMPAAVALGGALGRASRREAPGDAGKPDAGKPHAGEAGPESEPGSHA
jgi:hypothetical protein